MQPEGCPNADRSLESLEARLRALPQPAIPANLEARLRAAVPSVLPVRWRHRAVWLGLVAGSAAACLLAVFALRERFRQESRPGPEPRISVQRVQRGPREDSADVLVWREARRDLDADEMPLFCWPLVETVPMGKTKAIPSDLLD